MLARFRRACGLGAGIRLAGLATLIMCGLVLGAAGCGGAGTRALEGVASTQSSAPSGTPSGAPAATPTSSESATVQPNAGPSGSVHLLTPGDLAGCHQEGELVLVDIRPKSECEGDRDRLSSALCIPSAELESRHSELPRQAKIVVYGWGSGDDAAALGAANLLADKGFTQVYQLVGGLEGYYRYTREAVHFG